ncbi:PEPM [Symbiodinium microadriaticum]|nr:PEPM [Symbiodinium microadriaticum]
MLSRRGRAVAACLRRPRQLPSGSCLIKVSAVRSVTTAAARLPMLRAMVQEKRIVRVIEVHSGFSALVVDAASASRDGREVTFDCLWSSSLTSSAIKGKPDIETVTTSERLHIVDDVLEVSDKPILYDGDTGGAKEIFAFTVRKLERLGVSGVVIEDKCGLKQNSLFGTDRVQTLEDVDVFCDKIRTGKDAQVTSHFMIFARLEALIAGLGEEECLQRARAYVTKGGADGIMIHSKEKEGTDIFSFMKRWRQEFPDVPVIAVPTTYNHVTEDELQEAGINICIYANQLLRASYNAMLDTATKILQAGRAKEVDSQILPTKKMISLIDDNTEKSDC